MSVKVEVWGPTRDEETVWIWSGTGQDIYTYDWGTEEEQRIRGDWG